ncbi:MAG: glycerol-3-phosphate dehydrogenase, partial [Frankiaceae bacterium]|nr:glycerol-3-phosphate dehydrogenase [Frankiaceae bacterium]
MDDGNVDRTESPNEGARAAALSPAARATALSRVAGGHCDVVVIGGGVVGAGVALDAVTRGLTVALFEARDWAAGTSSRSSKLIHGGLRYLEMLNFRLVREALRERSLLIRRLAPHLVQPVKFLYPLTHRGWERLYVGAGLVLYDTMGLSARNGRGLPRHRHLSRRGALRLVPSLRRQALVGAVTYYDGQVDDARHTMALVRTAASHGADVISGARVVAFLRDGERVTGVKVRDIESGNEFEVGAEHVVNATGVWTDDTQALAGDRGQIHVRASKGVHLVVPKDRIDSRTGLILRTEESVLFVIPWGRHWIIGTTDTEWTLDKTHPAASRTDIDYLLEHVNRVLRTPLTRDDVQGVYAGLRPLLSGESERTSKLSREHTVASPAPGLVVVAGGKYTTYRVMAKDAVDAVVAQRPGSSPRCRTHRVPLVGAEDFATLWHDRHELAAAHGLPLAGIEHLLRRHGTFVHEVLELIAADASLGERLAGCDDYLRAEVVYAASHEGARHLEDVLTRRTRISIETFDRGVTAAPVAAALMAPVLGWSQDQLTREVELYLARV